MDWLRYQEIAYFPVYTKADKLSKNNQLRNAMALDSALGIVSDERLIFSAKTGQGRTELQHRLALNVNSC